MALNIEYFKEEDLDMLADAFRRGFIFTGYHLLVLPWTMEIKKQLLYSIFKPINTLSEEEQAEFLKEKPVPFQWIQNKVGQAGIYPTFDDWYLINDAQMQRLLNKVRELGPPTP
jgi:hypothetical protein